MTTQKLPNDIKPLIWFFVKPHKLWLLLASILASFSGIYGVVTAYLMKSLIDIVSNTASSELLAKAIMPAILLMLNAETHNLAWRGINYINIKVPPMVKNSVIITMLDYIHHHSFHYFQETKVGSITSNINRIVDCLEELISTTLSQFIRSLVQLICAIISMYFIHPFFSAALLSWVVVFFLVSISFSKKVRDLSDKYAKSHANVSGMLADSITSNASVRFFSRISYELRYLMNALKNMTRKYQDKEWFLIKLWWLQGSSITLLIGVMTYLLIKLKMADLVTAGDFAFILSVTLYVAENIWWMTEILDKMNDHIGSCQQAMKSLIIPHETVDKPGAKKLVISSGEIAFQEISFYYKLKTPLFSNKSITIQGGQKVGLVGYSGSGKTTFVNLILRLYDLPAGAILIDKQNIAEISQESLRENIGIIPQESILFHRSLMENIRYGCTSATDAEVIEAAMSAHAHEFIVEMETGYDTLVGERGIKLSGGQRQRIAIARAILKNAQILIFDEATSALDSVTESYIQDSLNILMKNKTVIVVAHRLATLLHMDRILVFDKGVIVEDGTHLELLAKDGLYSKLWNSQIGGFIATSAND